MPRASRRAADSHLGESSSQLPLTPRFAEMVSAATELLEAEGLKGVTMRKVADRLGIREASLYKHCAGRDQLLDAVAAEGLRQMASGRAEAVKGVSDRREKVRRLAEHHRSYATAHPDLYQLAFERLRTQAGFEPVPLLGSEELGWAAFAFEHGMVELERTGRLVPGAVLNATWEIGLEIFGGNAEKKSQEAMVSVLRADLRLHQEFVLAVKEMLADLPPGSAPASGPG